MSTATATEFADQTAHQITNHFSKVTTLREPPKFVPGLDGGVNVYLSVLDGLELISAHVSPQGHMTDLQSTIFNNEGESVAVTNMKKSGVWTTLKMEEVHSD